MGVFKVNPPRNRGGKRPGAGRPPDWLKAKCAAIVEKKKLVEFLGRVATGDETEPQMVRCGGDVTIEQCAPSIHDRLKAVEMLMDRGFGKPTSCDVNPLISPIQKVINDTALLKMLYAINYPDGRGTSGSDTTVVACRDASVQAGEKAA